MHGALWTPEKPNVHNAPIIEILENTELQTLLTTALWILGGCSGSRTKIQGGTHSSMVNIAAGTLLPIPDAG